MAGGDDGMHHNSNIKAKAHGHLTVSYASISYTRNLRLIWTDVRFSGGKVNALACAWGAVNMQAPSSYQSFIMFFLPKNKLFSSISRLSLSICDT